MKLRMTSFRYMCYAAQVISPTAATIKHWLTHKNHTFKDIGEPWKHQRLYYLKFQRGKSPF